MTVLAPGAEPRATLPQVAARHVRSRPRAQTRPDPEDRFQRHELDALPSALVELDDGLVVRRANRAAAALVGVPAGEMEGAAFAGLVAPEGRERADACLHALRCRSGPGSFDLDLVRARDRRTGGGVRTTVPVRVKAGAGGRRGDAALVLALEGRPAPRSGPGRPDRRARRAARRGAVRGRPWSHRAANAAADALLGAAPGPLLGRPLDGVLPEGLGAGGLRHALRAGRHDAPRRRQRPPPRHARRARRPGRARRRLGAPEGDGRARAPRPPPGRAGRAGRVCAGRGHAARAARARRRRVGHRAGGRARRRARGRAVAAAPRDPRHGGLARAADRLAATSPSTAPSPAPR